MKPIETENTNHNFGPPPNVTDGSIGDLPCQWVRERGYEEIVSVWEPTESERSALANGYSVRLGVGWIGAFPPVSLGVTHEGRRELKQDSGVDLIGAERLRQVTVEGWTDEHDDEHHENGALARAAAVYALPAQLRGERETDGLPTEWPWRDFYKPSPEDRIRELVKAGALIAAEIDRLQREAVRS